MNIVRLLLGAEAQGVAAWSRRQPRRTEPEMKRAACTIVSANYLHFAWTLAESFLALHPEDEFHLLLVDRLPDNFVTRNPRVQVHEVEKLGLSDFRSLSFKFDILELNTGVKPTFLKRLFASGIDKVIYFDPDIYVFHSLEPIYDALDSASIALTPHILTPTPDEDHVYEREMLGTGVYNLGFVAVSNSLQGHGFLDWWEQRCLQYGFHDLRAGLFVDQKWVNLVHCLFTDVTVLRHPGLNVAYWNLRERHLVEQHGKYCVAENLPLVFFHYSGYRPSAPDQLSTKLRVPYSVDDVLRKLLVFYGERLQANGAREYQNLAYSYGTFTDGTMITSLIRRLYSSTHDRWGDRDPFDATGSFFASVRKARLLSKQDQSGRYSASNLPVGDWRIRTINRVLFTLPRLIGGDRYSMLMKYLSFISILRNQGELIARGKPKGIASGSGQR